MCERPHGEEPKAKPLALVFRLQRLLAPSALMVYFSQTALNPQGLTESLTKTTKNCPPKKACFRGKFESKIARNSRLGSVFLGEGKSHLGYVLKTSGQVCVQHLYSSGPPGSWIVHEAHDSELPS